MTVAKSLEGANLVWQRVNEFMYANNGQSLMRATFLRDVKGFLATQKGNPKLQFVYWTGLTSEVVTTAEVSTGGATLYALYNIKPATNSTSTACYFKANDSATTAGGASGANAGICTVGLLLNKDEVGMIFQPGLVLATGIVVECSTTAAGGTDSSAGDGTNGFAILG